jgi:AraC-like DNA-binding protein
VIEDLGLRVGMRTSSFDLGSFGAILRRSITVYDYLRTGVRLIDTVTSGERFWLSSEAGRLRFHQWIPGKGQSGHAHSDLFSITVTMGTLRGFLGAGWTPSELALHAVHAECPAALEPLAGGRTMTGQSHTSFLIPRNILETPIARERRAAGDPERPFGLPAPELPQDFISSVHRLAESLLAMGDCRIECAAEAAGVSVRTFQRRLADSGMTYRGIVNAVRMEFASRWLASTEKPVLEIALDLGYEEASNFTRAFRLRTGVSPQQYRRRCRECADPADGVIAGTGV